MYIDIKEISLGNKVILKNFNTILDKGETICVIGRNGVGKSTLFKTLVGDTRFKGANLLENTNIGIVSDYSKLPPELKVKDIINANTLQNKYLQEIDDVFDLMKIKDSKISRWSTGEQRKLKLYNILTQNKELYIFDEITNGLDEKSLDEVLNVIVGLINRDKKPTILYSTYRLNEVTRVKFDKYWFFNNQEIIISGILKEEDILKYYYEDGEVFSCCSQAGRSPSLSIGNIKNNRLSEVGENYYSNIHLRIITNMGLRWHVNIAEHLGYSKLSNSRHVNKYHLCKTIFEDEEFITLIRPYINDYENYIYKKYLELNG